MKKIFGVFMFLCAMNVWSGPTIGKAAPEFSLKGVDGKTHKLSDYKGKTVVLEWVNHDCPFVKKHYSSPQNNMQSLQKTYTDKGVVWLSINSSAKGKQGHYSPEEWKKLSKEKGSKATAILLDENGVVGKEKYDALVTPHMYIINPEGTLVYAGGIDSIPSAEAGDISKAKPYVKNALDEVLANKKVTVASWDCRHT